MYDTHILVRLNLQRLSRLCYGLHSSIVCCAYLNLTKPFARGLVMVLVFALVLYMTLKFGFGFHMYAHLLYVMS